MVHSLRIETEYPFSESVDVKVEADAGFIMELRIPGWCNNARITVNGMEIKEHVVLETMHPVRISSGETHVHITLPMEIRIDRCPPYLASLGAVVPENAASISSGCIGLCHAD